MGRGRTVIALALAASGLGGGASAETLAEALRLAYLNNPQLDQQRVEAEIAGETLEQARAQGRTQVSVSGSAGYQSSDTNRAFAFDQGELPIANLQFQAVKPVYTGGRIDAGIRQAEAGIEAADARLAGTRQTLIVQTVTTYRDVIRDREVVEIRKNNVAVLEEQVRAARDRFDVGVVTRTDVALAEARLEGARANVAAAEAQLENSIATYEFLVGRLPGKLAPPPPSPPLPATFEDALAEAVTHNPDLIASRYNERAAGEAVRVAEGQLKPQIDIIGSASAQQTFRDDLRDTTVSALARGSVPLFQGGLINSQIRTAKLRRSQARLNTQALERQVRAQLASSWYQYLAAQRALEASRRQVEAAEIAYEGAKEELAVGVRTTLDVLDQEQQLFEARLSVVSADRDVYVAAYQLLRSLGRLSIDAVGLPRLEIEADSLR